MKADGNYVLYGAAAVSGNMSAGSLAFVPGGEFMAHECSLFAPCFQGIPGLWAAGNL